MPLDEHVAVRTAATLRFWRHLASGRSKAGLPQVDPRLRRARLSVRALDGRRAGASYRTVAEVLFGAQHIDPVTWRTASVRDTTIRLVRGGLELMNGGYRRLLRRGASA